MNIFQSIDILLGLSTKWGQVQAWMDFHYHAILSSSKMKWRYFLFKLTIVRIHLPYYLFAPAQEHNWGSAWVYEFASQSEKGWEIHLNWLLSVYYGNRIFQYIGQQNNQWAKKQHCPQYFFLLFMTDLGDILLWYRLNF